MTGLDIKQPYQNVAIAMFLHFLGGSQENETWIAMFVRDERYEERSGVWDILLSNIVPQQEVPVMLRP